MNLLLVCHDVERHPGPSPSPTVLSHVGLTLSFFQLKQVQNRMTNKKCTVEELIPLIEVCIGQVVKDLSNIEMLEKRVACLEREQRRKNVVVFGVPTEICIKLSMK
jgi:hypothetical protein